MAGAKRPKKKKPSAQLDGTKKERELFLEAYREAGTISNACRVAKVPRSTVYYWRDHCKAFAKQLEEVGLEANELLIGEARRRAYQGTLRKKFEKGQPIIDPETHQQYVEREYSDTLLMFMIKAKNPEYRDRQQLDVNVTVDLADKVKEARKRVQDAGKPSGTATD